METAAELVKKVEMSRRYGSFDEAVSALKKYVKDVKNGEWADYVHIMRVPQEEDAFIVVDDYTGHGSPVMLAMYRLNYSDITTGDVVEELESADKERAKYAQEVIDESLKYAREHYDEQTQDQMSHP